MDLRKLFSGMGSLKMSSFLAIFLLGFAFNGLSEARHLKKLASAVVVGSVYCDTCFPDDFSKTSHFISGALVAVECRGSNSEPTFREEVKTDDNGEFKVHLPFSVHKHIKKIKSCSVKLISSGERTCAVASTSTSSSTLHLKSKDGNKHIFSAGFFSFKPLKQPTFCDEFSKGEVTKTQLPLVPILPSPPSIFPPNPFQPPPSILPPNPFQPSPPSIFPPNPFQPPPPSIFPPNPFQPPPSPPSIFPPNPFQPPPSPPSIFPPNPFQPPPSPPPSLFPPIIFPPIPGFTHPPPPPPPPPPSILPPIPPFPGIPIPPFPGIPPASSSKETSP